MTPIGTEATVAHVSRHESMSLMAPLDRLGSAKELAQIGAAIGREFSHGTRGAPGQKLYQSHFRFQFRCSIDGDLGVSPHQ